MAKLTAKQELFAFHYVDTLNATEAARRAGYRGSETVLAGTGYDNRRKPHIAARIDELMQAKMVGSDEVLLRLQEQATASIADFLNISPHGDSATIEPSAVKAKGHLIRKINIRRRSGTTARGGEYDETSIRLELYSAQKALELLAKHFGLFTEEMILTWKKEAEEAGVPASELFEKMVQTIIVEMKSGS